MAVRKKDLSPFRADLPEDRAWLEAQPHELLVEVIVQMGSTPSPRPVDENILRAVRNHRWRRWNVLSDVRIETAHLDMERFIEAEKREERAWTLLEQSHALLPGFHRQSTRPVRELPMPKRRE